MNHERMREQLALRLYGEIDPAEEQALAAHLRDCAACARFAGELEQGLGRARELPSEAALPAGWDARLAGATARVRRGAFTREVLLVGSGLAAGVLAMLAFHTSAKPASVASADPDAPAFLRYQGSTPPPLATGGGPAARYLAWKAR